MVSGGATTVPTSTATTPARIGSLGWLGWVAAVILVGVLLVPALRPQNYRDKQLLAQLKLDNTGTLRVTMAPQAGSPDKNLAGEVIWNGDLQQGFLRFKGLARNDPKKEQYQLWIFDAGRTDSDAPVDGGVFDLATGFTDDATGDVYIPIQAKLNVRQPAAFAVTLETPGGVVVTKKERLVALGAVPPKAK